MRRIYIEKEDGRKRPISIPSLEDKIVQKATVTLLNAIYEPDFLACSYGFRPGRSAQDALDEVGRDICQKPTAYVLELDIAAYFDSIVREQLMAMIEQRISDASILRLLRKWINVGVIDEGRLLVSETGTGQGQISSPLLANVYLHYVLDSGKSGSTAGRGGTPSLGSATHSSCIAIRSRVHALHGLGQVRRVIPEEPTAVVPHGGVCEGRGGQPPRLLGVETSAACGAATQGMQ